MAKPEGGGRAAAIGVVVTAVGGLIALVTFAIVDWPSVFSWYKNGRIGPNSPDVAFLYGRWCGQDGRIQEFRRSADGAVLVGCFPDVHGDCEEAFAANESLVKYDIRFGWSDGDVLYTTEGMISPVRVKRDAPDAIRTILAGNLQGESYRRCSLETN